MDSSKNIFHFQNNSSVIGAESLVSRISRLKKIDKSTSVIGITGVTGLLGRNLFFEVIKENSKNLDKLYFVLLGRSKKNQLFRDRITTLLLDDGKSYFGNENRIVDKILSRIITVELDLLDKKALSESSSLLKGIDFHYFFHFSAKSDFRKTQAIYNSLYLNNVIATKNLLEWLSQTSVKQFIFTGTAYSAEFTEELQYPNAFNHKKKYRNYYEKTKELAEILVREYAERQNLPIKIFRPVGICGRMIENPIGAISKFDLFYGWALFFYKLKSKLLPPGDTVDILKQKAVCNLRICCPSNTFLNFVPADYAAKVIWKVSNTKTNEDSFFTSLSTPIKSRDLLMGILSYLNIDGIQFVDNIPDEQTKLEKQYYSLIGDIFTDYLCLKRVKFYTSSSFKHILSEIKEPEFNLMSLNKLMDYALSRKFMLNKSTDNGMGRQYYKMQSTILDSNMNIRQYSLAQK